MEADYKARWIEAMGRLENSADVTAGRVFVTMPHTSPEMEPARRLAGRAALAKFVELSRLARQLSREELAGRAGIAVEDVVCIEDDENYSPEPRVVLALATCLEASTAKLLVLAGLAEPREPTLLGAAVKFAAKSEPLRNLSQEERDALEEFVKVLSQ